MRPVHILFFEGAGALPARNSFVLADAGVLPARLKVVDAERTSQRERSEDGSPRGCE